MKLTIETGDQNPILRAVAKPVKSTDFAANRILAEAMLAYVKNPKNKGIGLAAPQVGVSKRMIVVGLPKTRDDESYPLILMVNPVITAVSKEKDIDEEGCLSLPGLTSKVERSIAVEVAWNDIKGKKMKKRIIGYGARVVQHEVDHLDGILISDKFLK